MDFLSLRFIQKMNKLAENMVTKYGMSSLGPIYYDPYEKYNNNNSREEIDKEIIKIINNANEFATKIMQDEIDHLYKQFWT